MLDHVGGYREDPLRKKSALLAMVLNNRPEKFFEFGNMESLPPFVDYHCMRSNLRMGLLDVKDVLDLEDAELNTIMLTIESLGDESQSLKAIYQALDEAYDYGVIRCVLASMY